MAERRNEVVENGDVLKLCSAGRCGMVLASDREIERGICDECAAKTEEGGSLKGGDGGA